MLETLHISNYALIDAVDIRFYPGLDIITGETGAGKSIMLGALSLLLGGRADTKAVRSADRKSVIEAVFAIEAYPHLRQVFAEADIDWDPQRCILRREIAPNGRSRAFVNDSPVPLSRLQEIAINLIDIHSQHNNQLLSQPGFQLQVIDTLAGNAERLREYGRRFDAFRSAVRQLKKTKARLERVRDDEQFTRYQLEQLDSARLQSGELEQLEKDREVLGNLTAVKSDLYDALQALSDGSSNAISLVDEAAGACDRLGAALDETDDIPGRLATIRIELADIAATLSETDAGLSADPRELEAAEERIDTLYSLLSRHKAETVDQLIERREELRARLEQLDDSDTTVADLEREARRALALAKESAAEITATRRRAAADFAAMLRERAMPLGMKNLQVEVRVDPADISATGMDRVEFMFAFNKNQPLMPVGGAASGGEISRLMLCVKAIIADRMSLPSIIFDEIDTGVSGEVASRIGDMMESISRSLQVIAITHLPQVAARGGHHFKVFKEDDDTSTHTRIAELDYDARVAELAMMLGGESSAEAARANAVALLAGK